ncbi:MAG: class I tRNA ligase family protein [Anaerolineae bacterium]
MFKPVSSKMDFAAMEREILKWWKETDQFNKLRRLRAGAPKWSFIDGPITANNPMGVHHAWGRTYKDLFQRYHAMQGYDERWQNGFDCQGLWVEVNVEKDLGFKTKRDIENYGLAEFVTLCKQRVLNFAAVQTQQSVRLGMWMDWNDPTMLQWLKEELGRNPEKVITVDGPQGPVTDTVEQIVGRLGLPELGGSYFTFSTENNYDIWAFLKQCHENGWVYKGTDVMPWCVRCGTGLSEHEISTEDYPDLTHPSLTIKMPLKDRPGESLLVWTTTPWTLTSNVAVAVGPDLTYLKVKQGNDVLYLSEGAQKMLKGQYEVLGKLSGKEMEGWPYTGPFDDLPAEQEVGGHVSVELRQHIPPSPQSAAEAHRVILWKEVSAEEGTGLVHIAPGCGAEDFQLGKEYTLPVVAPLDEAGIFMEGFGPLSGMSVFEVEPVVTESLREKGILYRREPYTHRYPTCWRCKSELVFRLVDEWYISTGPVYDKPRVELTPEEKAHSLRYQIMDAVDEARWVPGFGYEREMDWLRNMHDWMISKKRYYGLALPIWECSQCGSFDVIGSREELQARAVVGWDRFDGHTPHRPYVDEIKVACSKCGGLSTRVRDVGNPWLDAGIVSISTLRWRTDRAYWEKWFPADFVTESFPGQFRNWFYSLLIMSTVMAHRSPFKTLMGYGTLFAEDGRPMHKSLGNMIEFNEAAEKIGVDVMRWEYAKARYESNLLFGYHTAEEARRLFLLPLWNVYSFLVTYANLDNWKPRSATEPGARTNALDVWIVARLQQMAQEMTAALDDYDSPRAARVVEPFIDDLSNWYLRRSRRRFWKSEGDADKESAYSTLYYVLVTLCKLLAPFMPFATEEMYQNLVRSVDSAAPESVHHCEWPQARPELMDEPMLESMGLALQIASLGRSARSKANVKLRQPLARVVVKTMAPEERAAVEKLAEHLLDELNVKALEFTDDERELVDYKVSANPAKLGPKYGKRVGAVRNAVSALNPAMVARKARSNQSVQVEVEGEKLDILPEELNVQVSDKPGWAASEESGYLVAVDTRLTPELEREGLAREFVRQVQSMRKDAGLNIEDHIRTCYETDSDKLRAMVQSFGSYVQRETLSDELVEQTPGDGFFTAEAKLDGQQVKVGIQRV